MDRRAGGGGSEEEEEGDAIDEEGGHLMQTMSNENDAGGLLLGLHGQEWAGISALEAFRETAHTDHSDLKTEMQRRRIHLLPERCGCRESRRVAGSARTAQGRDRGGTALQSD